MRNRLDAVIREEQDQHEQWTTEVEVAPPSGSGSRALAGLIYAVAAAIVLAAVPWLLRPAPPAADTPPSTPPVPAPTAPAEPNQRTVEWSHTELPVRVNALVVHAGRFFAIGGSLVLASDDGINWTEIGRLPSGASVGQLVSHGPLLVARGAEIAEDGQGGPVSTSAVWMSEDHGANWSRANIEGDLTDMTSSPLGLVVTGSLDLGQDGDRVRRRAAAWLTDDGKAWTRVWSSEDPDGTSSTADAVMWNGVELAVLGRRGPNRYPGDAPGRQNAPWERLAWIGPTVSELTGPLPIDLPGSIETHGRTFAGHTVLVYGFDRSAKESSAVWANRNGIDWSPVHVDAGPWSYDGVAADGSTIVITGSTLGASDNPEPRVWLSTDGATWESADVSSLPKKVRLASAAIHKGVLVVVGYHDTSLKGYLITGRVSP